MRNSVKKGMASLSVVGLCILAFLAICLPQAMANGPAADARTQLLRADGISV